MAKVDPVMQNTQQLATRYFMAQFWCEFTKEVLTEFLNEDFLIKEMHNETKKKPDATGSDFNNKKAVEVDLLSKKGDQGRQSMQSVKISPRLNMSVSKKESIKANVLQSERAPVANPNLNGCKEDKPY